MTGSRRLSQAIAEGDGISVLVEVADGAGARAAEAQGAEGVVVRGSVDGLRTVTALPLLQYGGGPGEADADAFVLAAGWEGDELDRLVDGVSERGLECVFEVRDEDDLERVLDTHDPEILLLSAAGAEEHQSHVERLLELLPDVPAGKLAIAELAGATRGDVEELERAGVDAVLVRAADVGPLVGEPPPEV